MGKEIFKPIPNYEGLYEISNKCRIKALPKEVFRDKCGVKKFPESFKRINKSNQVCLFKDKKRKWLCVKKIYMLVFENKEIKNTKYESLTYENGIPKHTTHRRIVALAKLTQKTKKCKLTGVSFNTSKGKPYQSCIEINKRNIHLGYFYTEEEANLMYRKASENKHLYKDVPKLFREMLNYLLCDGKNNY